MRDNLDSRAAMGAALADQRRGNWSVAEAVRRPQPRRGRSLESDVGVRGSDRGSRRGHPRGGYAQDPDQSRVCGQDGSARCAPRGRCLAPRQRRRHLLSAAGDSRFARVGAVSVPPGAVAGESQATDSRVVAAIRRRDAEGPLHTARAAVARSTRARGDGRTPSCEACGRSWQTSECSWCPC